MHKVDMKAIPRDTCATSVDVHRMEHVDIDNDNQSWFHCVPVVQVLFGHKDKTPAENVNAVSLVGRWGPHLLKRTPQARRTRTPVIPLIARMITASQHLPARQIALVQSAFLFSNPN